MTATRRTVRHLVALGLAIGLVSAACGGDDDDATSTTTPGTTAAPVTTGSSAGSSTSAAEPAGEWDPNGEYTASWFLGRGGLDPATVSAQNTQYPYMAPAYDRLIQITADGSLAPMLATEWGFNDDGSIFEMKLRDDVTFQDGTPFDAEAAAANLERGKSHPESTSAAEQLDSVTEIEVVDPTTLRLHVTPGAIALPYYLSGVTGMMVSPAAFENPDLDRNPVGSGAYEVEEFIPDEKVTYVRVPGEYWGGADAAKAARFTLLVVADDNARMNSLEAGEVDFIGVRGDTIDQATELGEQTDDYQLVRASTSAWFGPGMNFASPKLADVRVRQALNYAIDKEAIVDFLGGNCQVTGQPMKDGWAGYDSELDDYYAYDPEKAKQLLAEANVSDLTLDVITDAGFEPQQTMATILQEMWAEVGITANVRPLDFSEGVEVFRGGQTDLWVSQRSALPFAEIQMVRRLNPTQNPGDVASFSQRVADLYKGVEDQTIAGDDREKLLTDLNRAMVEDAATIEICWADSIMLGTADMVGLDNIPFAQVAMFDPRYFGVTER